MTVSMLRALCFSASGTDFLGMDPAGAPFMICRFMEIKSMQKTRAPRDDIHLWEDDEGRRHHGQDDVHPKHPTQEGEIRRNHGTK